MINTKICYQHFSLVGWWFVDVSLPFIKPSITMVIKDTSVAKACRKSVLFCSIDLPFYIIYRERQKLWSFCGFIRCKDSNRFFLTTLVHVHYINYENAWLYLALCSSVLFYEFRGRCSTLYIFLFHSLYPPYK